MMAIKIISIIICAYFAGNINFAIILSRGLRKDIRNSGSGNPGTVNMARTFGAKWGALTLLLDALKGALPALAGYYILGSDPLGFYVAGFAVVLGHMLPIIYKFKGGKGVATSIGVFFAANPLFALASFAVAMLYLCVHHYGFVCSLIFVTAMTVVEIFFGKQSILCEPARIMLVVAIFVAVVVAHRKNFARLLSGKENKLYLFGKKKPRDIETPQGNQGKESKDQ